MQPIAVTPPIRVLVMISSPTDYPSLDVEAEWQRLNEALGDLIKAGTLLLERMEEATLAALQRRLRRSQYHIFHFIGHGEFDQTLQEGVLLLEREKQRGHRVGSQYLGMLLHDHESLRIAILNACEGARSSQQDPVRRLGADAWCSRASPPSSRCSSRLQTTLRSTFAHELYGALADGYPIDAAVTEARKAIFALGREVEWATPVLYLRAPDGRIFDVDRSAAVTPAATVAQPGPEAAPPPSVVTTQIEPLATMTPKEQSVALLRSAGRALGTGDFAGALEVLQHARALDPSCAGTRRPDGDGRRTASRCRNPREAASPIPRASRRRGGAVDQARPRGRIRASRRGAAAPSGRSGSTGHTGTDRPADGRGAGRRGGGRPARRLASACRPGAGSSAGPARGQSRRTGSDRRRTRDARFRAARPREARGSTEESGERRKRFDRSPEARLRRAWRAAPSACAACSRTDRRRPTRPNR